MRSFRRKHGKVTKTYKTHKIKVANIRLEINQFIALFSK